ncbi:hypothetical protein Trydic_g3201 [Trypoxylus dichotomus]
MCDKAHFHILGSVDRNNSKYWITELPQQVCEQPLHSRKVTEWCNVVAFGILGQYFLKGAEQVILVEDDDNVDYMFRKLRQKHARWGLEINMDKTEKENS